MSEETALTVVEPNQWALAKRGPERSMKAIALLSGANGLNPFDLPRISVPGAGGQYWEVDGQPSATFDGVIIYAHDSRQWWDQPYGTGERTPPTCESYDGIIGHGTPGGECAKCPLAKRAEKSSDRNCAPTRVMYILRDKLVLPTMLRVPRMSLSNARDYFKKELIPNGLMPSEVMTRFGLEKRQGQGKSNYSAVTFANLGEIPGELRAMIEEFSLLFATEIDQANRKRITAVQKFRNEMTDPDRADKRDVTASGSAWGGLGLDDTEDNDDDIPL